MLLSLTTMCFFRPQSYTFSTIKKNFFIRRCITNHYFLTLSFNNSLTDSEFNSPRDIKNFLAAETFFTFFLHYDNALMSAMTFFASDVAPMRNVVLS